MSELIITNGDAVADILSAAGLGGRIVPWRDVLHEGPLIPSDSLDALSQTRATYLAARFDIPFAEARADFLARDAIVMAHDLFTELSIWLEHDLYDQLQLLQILHFLDSEGRTMGVRLIQADDFLATQQPQTVLRFAAKSIDVTPSMLSSAANVWRALTSPTPMALVEHINAPANEFRFLRSALGRFIEELPSLHGGLSRTERAIGTAVSAGGLRPIDVFAHLLASEDAPFLGDWSTYRILDDLAGAGGGPRPNTHARAAKMKSTPISRPRSR
ncbi:MAG: hypothetical protein ACTSWI_00520 [Alphaproteobacteria bacterium]